MLPEHQTALNSVFLCFQQVCLRYYQKMYPTSLHSFFRLRPEISMIEMIEKGKESELEKTAKYYNRTVKS